MSDSLLKGAFRSFANTFCKIIGAAVAITVLFIALATFYSSAPQRQTSIITHPTHQWKTKPFSPVTPTVLAIPVIGTIGYGSGIKKHDLHSIFQDLEILDLQPGVLKAIVLYIDTPGGTADDADAVFRMLTEFKQNKQIPVYAYIDGICASGGIFVSLAADTVIATTPSIIGSVGVAMGTSFNVSDTMKRLGIASTTIHAGKNKDNLNPFRPWKENEAQSMQKLIDSSYDRFVGLVSHYRPRLTEDRLREEGAGVFSAEKALSLGFIDKVSDSFTQTLEEIVTSLDIANNYQVVELRPELGIQTLLGPETCSLFAKKVEHHLQLPGELPPEVAGRPLYLYRP